MVESKEIRNAKQLVEKAWLTLSEVNHLPTSPNQRILAKKAFWAYTEACTRLRALRGQKV